MSDFRPDLDMRTCSVCDKLVAFSLRGYMQSIRACGAHLEEWRRSDERQAAAAIAWSRLEAMGRAPYEAWAAGKRARMQAREET